MKHLILCPLESICLREVSKDSLFVLLSENKAKRRFTWKFLDGSGLFRFLRVLILTLDGRPHSDQLSAPLLRSQNSCRGGQTFRLAISGVSKPVLASSVVRLTGEASDRSVNTGAPLALSAQPVVCQFPSRSGGKWTFLFIARSTPDPMVECRGFLGDFDTTAECRFRNGLVKRLLFIDPGIPIMRIVKVTR